jgi:hypothetical protein
LNTITTILIVIGIGILIYNFYNTYSIRSFFNRTYKRSEINDQKYWELKFKIESLITTFSVIIAVAGYLGFSTIKDVKDQVTKEIRPQIDSATLHITAVENTVKSLRDSLTKYKNEFNYLDSGATALQDSLSHTKGGFSKLLLDIAAISKKNKIQAQVYIVNDLELIIDKPQGDPYYVRNFSALITSTGDKLPTFNKPPLVFAVSKTGGSMYLKNITNTSFELVPGDYLGERPIISLIIFQVP